MTLSIPRKLSKEEKAKIDTFVRSVRPEMTTWQPTESQGEYDAKIPEDIKKLLLELIPLSVNDHLLRYLDLLNNKRCNQNQIYFWLKSIKEYHSSFSDAENKGGELYQVVFREAARLALETSIGFATDTMNSLAARPLFTNKAKLMEIAKELIELFKSKGGLTQEKTINQVLAKQPKPILFRSRSDTAALGRSCALDTVDPRQPAQPLTPLVLPTRLVGY